MSTDVEYLRCQHTGRVCACPRSPDALALLARRILEQQARIPPRERFSAMVRSGLIDDKGRLRKKYGGLVP